MYSTPNNDVNGLFPECVMHAHPLQEAEVEFIPNLSQLEAEVQLLGNIRTGTPSPPPCPPTESNTDCYAEWDPSPSPEQEVWDAPLTSQQPGPQEPPTLTFINDHSAWISIRCPIPQPPDPPTEHPNALPQREASPGGDQDQQSSLHVLFQNMHHISQQTTTVLEAHQKTHDVFIVLEPWYGRLRAMGPDTQFTAVA